MGRHQIHTTTTVAVLACALLLTAWTAPAPAQESNEKAAREMVEGVLRNTEKSRTGDLGAWSRGVIKRALKRTGENTSQTPAPLPAEAQADRLAGSLSTPARGPEVIVFMSLSVPEASWREWSLEAARAGVPLVLRGLVPEGLKATVKRVGALLAEGAGAAIDPRPFRLFGIEVIPAVAVVPGRCPRLVRAVAAQRTRRRPMTASGGTSAWKRHSGSLPRKAGQGARRHAVISQSSEEILHEAETMDEGRRPGPRAPRTPVGRQRPCRRP